MYSIFSASVGHFVARQRKNIISCFLVSFTHQVEVVLLMFFNILTLHYFIQIISKKHQEIRGGLRAILCRNQWVTINNVSKRRGVACKITSVCGPQLLSTHNFYLRKLPSMHNFCPHLHHYNNSFIVHANHE